MKSKSFKPEEFWSLKVLILKQDDKNNLITSNIFQIENGNKIEKFSFKNKIDINQAIEKIKNR